LVASARRIVMDISRTDAENRGLITADVRNSPAFITTAV
jgi:hypothetical protein